MKEVGNTHKLNVFRNWMAIESYMNKNVALPQMHYTILNMDGTFKAVAEEYSFTVSGEGYRCYTGSVTLTENDTNSFNITLTKTAIGAWDGVSQTAVEAGSDDFYYISNAAELAWFAANAGDKDAVLTKNIDLADYAWPGIGTYTGTFDGNGHTVTGLYT